MTRYLCSFMALVSAAAGIVLFARPDLFHLPPTFSFAGLVIAGIWLAATAVGAGRIDRLPWLFALPVALRLLTLPYLQSVRHVGDPASYLTMASNILRAGDFSVPPFIALFPPLYPTLLAGAAVPLGLSALTVMGLGLIVDGLIAWSIWQIGREARAGRAGLVAAWLWLMWPASYSARVFRKRICWPY